MNKFLPLHILLFFFVYSPLIFAQSPVDSSDRIEILRGNSTRFITLDDSTSLRTLAGNARVKQGNTILSGDSIVINSRTQVAEVFGNVHINDADTVNTYANYLRYLGKERVAYLKRNVKLTDGKGTLLTDDLTYDLANSIATYKDGGKVITGTTVLTSTDAIYYSDSVSSTIADNMFYDEKTGIGILEGRAKYVDSVNHIIAIGNRIETNQKTASFLATQKPVVIIVKDKDSTYIAADTLFSGLRKYDSATKKNYTLSNIVHFFVRNSINQHKNK